MNIVYERLTITREQQMWREGAREKLRTRVIETREGPTQTQQGGNHEASALAELREALSQVSSLIERLTL